MTKILLVEDDSFISELYSNKFSNAGYNIEVAVNGVKGLELLKKYKPDVILLDIIMPEMNGFDFLLNIKKNKELAGIPIIVLTNLGDKDDIDKAMTLGATSYIIKSHFTPSEVVNKVEEILKTHNT